VSHPHWQAPEEGTSGVSDKRLLVVETEFTSPLKVMSREGNILSPTLRNAWDGKNLRTLTRNSPLRSTTPHISIIGHTTREELRRYLSDTEMWNGFANRFLWICVARSKTLPEGGHLDPAVLSPLERELRRAVQFARSARELKLDDDARLAWHEVYSQLSAGRPGLAGAATSRAETVVRRLACLYALLDRQKTVHRAHLVAALALWEYAHASAACIFGGTVGDNTADPILNALRVAPNGLTRTQIRDLLGRHKKTKEVERALTLLQGCGLVECKKSATAGRPVERWVCVSHATKAIYATPRLVHDRAGGVKGDGTVRKKPTRVRRSVADKARARLYTHG
jgi:hypothetical protein